MGLEGCSVYAQNFLVGCRAIMKYSQLVPFLVLLLQGLGEVGTPTDFQEDCAGDGALTSGVRFYGHTALRRDVTWLKIKKLQKQSHPTEPCVTYMPSFSWRHV